MTMKVFAGKLSALISMLSLRLLGGTQENGRNTPHRADSVPVEIPVENLPNVGVGR
jgi:hypothetical protein